MGIKFLCPNGHKLNVKTFLAGKRAICPKCQARVTVPMASADNEASGGSTILTSEDMAAAGLPPTFPSPGDALVPAAQDTAIATVARQVAAVQLADPITEAPSAVWYVRPASGGQFGPASGDIMRSWIQEGRVGASSLVWRAGWSDWKPAAATFPQLAALAAPPGGPVVVVPVAAGANGVGVVASGNVVPGAVLVAERASGAAIPEALGPLVPPVRRKRREADDNLVASGVLVVIILILIVVLAVVFMRKDASAEKESPEAPPAREAMAN